MGQNANALPANLTMFGILDDMVEIGNSGNGTAERVTSSGYLTQRFGVRGLEDLGNGLKAGFWIESSLGAPLGTAGAGVTTTSAAAGTKFTGTTYQFWDRNATVGLISPTWGALNLGRQYTAWFAAYERSDYFRVAGIGSNYALQLQSTRLDNAVRWDSPSWGGLKLALDYGLGDQGAAYGYATSVGGTCTNAAGASICPSAATGLNTANVLQSGREVGAAALYDNGPWMASAGYRRANSVAAIGSAVVHTSQWSVNGGYNFGMAKVNVNYSAWNNDINPRTLDKNTWSVQGNIPIGTTSQVTLGYQHLKDKALDGTGVAGDASQWGAQYAYFLSKRTTLYATYGRMQNQTGTAYSLLSAPALTNNAAPGAAQTTFGFGQSIFDFGIAHIF
jgi:predicted porin